MKALLELCLRRRFAVLALVLVVCALGARSAIALPIDAVPDITNVQVQILTNAPSLGPIDVERNITFHVEAAMSGLPGVEEIRSVSRFGISAVTVVFEEDTDLARARQLVAERLADARENIPREMGVPSLGPMSTGLGEVLQFELHGEGQSLMELREILDWFVTFELRSVPGVVEVNAFGGELKTYEVRVDPERLQAFGLALADVYQALDEENAIAGGGAIARGGEQLIVRGEARLEDEDEIGDVLVSTSDDGVPIRVRDVAEVALAPMIRHGAATRDGRGEVVTGIVMMRVGANSRQVVEDVKARIERLRGSLPPGVEIDVFYDRADLVNRTIRTVATNLAEGALFVVAVLFVLLGTVRGGLIVAAAIPFALLVAFIGMELVGVSGNLMSLGAIDFGIVVDGSIIVVESALVHLTEARRARGRALGYREASEVVLRSTLDVRRAATFGEAIIVIVYVPILTLAGIEGKMFKPMAITVLFALAGALVASLTFVPILSATFLRQQEAREPFIVRKLHAFYAPLLAKAIAFPRITILAALVVLVGAGLLATQLGAEFVPRLDEGAIAIELNRLPSVSLAEANRGATRAEAILLTFPEVATVVSKTGRPEIATDPMGLEQSDVMVMLHPREEWTTGRTRDELVHAMREKLEAELPGMAFGFSQPIELRFAELISGSRSDVAITIYGGDLEELQRISLDVQRTLRRVEGATDVRGEALTGFPSLEVAIDREAASRYGVHARDVLDAIAAVGGDPVGFVYEEERRFPLVVRLPEDLRSDIDRLASVPVRASGGTLVPLGQVARLEIVDSPASVSRESVRRRTTVQANVEGRDLAGFVERAQEAVEREVRRPPGYVIAWGGQHENLREANERLAFAVPIAIGLVFALLVLAFGEMLPALVIFANVPFAAVGGIVALTVRGMPMSVSAAVGFIALCGLAVLNGVVLLSTLQKLRAEGHDAIGAATKAAEERFRAVITTAAVAALGFLPMALSTSAGAEVQRPLATVVIGGLVSSTLLTLFVLPSVACALERRRGPRESLPPA